MAGASQLSPRSSPQGRAYPPNAPTTVENCFSSKSRFAGWHDPGKSPRGGDGGGQAVDATRARSRMWDEVGSEPGAISEKVCLTQWAEHDIFKEA